MDEVLAGFSRYEVSTNVIGFTILKPKQDAMSIVGKLTKEIFEALGDSKLSLEINMDDCALGEGYGQVTVESIEAIRLTARLEGFFLDPVLPLIFQIYRVTIFDQRGTGQSGACDVPLTMQQMADDAALVLNQLKDKPVHLIGHSAGSGVSLMLASRQPERISSIVLLASWTKSDAWMRRVFDVRLNALKQYDTLLFF